MLTGEVAKIWGRGADGAQERRLLLRGKAKGVGARPGKWPKGRNTGQGLKDRDRGRGKTVKVICRLGVH